MISAQEFGAKYSSKREVYRFLASDVKIYLPDYQTVTVWHLRDLACGRRNRIKGTDVKYMSIPQFEGLTVDDLLEYAENEHGGVVM